MAAHDSIYGNDLFTLLCDARTAHLSPEVKRANILKCLHAEWDGRNTSYAKLANAKKKPGELTWRGVLSPQRPSLNLAEPAPAGSIVVRVHSKTRRGASTRLDNLAKLATLEAGAVQQWWVFTVARKADEDGGSVREAPRPVLRVIRGGRPD